MLGDNQEGGGILSGPQKNPSRALRAKNVLAASDVAGRTSESQIKIKYYPFSGESEEFTTKSDLLDFIINYYDKWNNQQNDYTIFKRNKLFILINPKSENELSELTIEKLVDFIAKLNRLPSLTISLSINVKTIKDKDSFKTRVKTILYSKPHEKNSFYKLIGYFEEQFNTIFPYFLDGKEKDQSVKANILSHQESSADMEKKLYDKILNETFKYFIATGNDIILESPIDDNYKVNFDQDRTSDNISDDIFDYIGDDTITIKHINISPSFFINPNYILNLKYYDSSIDISDNFKIDIYKEILEKNIIQEGAILYKDYILFNEVNNTRRAAGREVAADEDEDLRPRARQRFAGGGAIKYQKTRKNKQEIRKHKQTNKKQKYKKNINIIFKSKLKEYSKSRKKYENAVKHKSSLHNIL